MVTRSDVSGDAIVDFGHHSDEFNLNELTINADLRQRCPVAWNENYGGFWFLTSYDAVSQTARDGDTFAHKYEPNAADGVDYQGEMGVPRPEGQPALGIGEVDGPYHKALRHALAPFFSPGAVQKMQPFMEQQAHWFLDQRVADGQMDLVLDYASPVPAILTIKLMCLPYDNWRLYANLFHSVMAVPPRQPRQRKSHRRSPRHDARGSTVRGHQAGQAGRRPDQLPGPVRIRRPAPHRRTAAQHSLEPHRRRRRHHDVTDRADPAAPGHPPGAAAQLIDNQEPTTTSRSSSGPTKSFSTGHPTATSPPR